MTEPNSPSVHLGGRLLTIGKGGVNVNYNDTVLSVRSGKVTSSTSEIVIKSRTYGTGNRNEVGDLINLSFAFSVSIQDHKNYKVGLVLKGTHPRGERGIVWLGGSASNTFTGDTIVEGVYNILYLSKANGATAIAGDFNIKAGAASSIVESDQISDSSRVTLMGYKSSLGFSSLYKDLKEKNHELIVENNMGVLSFGHNPKNRNDNSKKTFILDDLIINAGASLKILGWKEGRDHLLVRKDSKHLADALKKLVIGGWGKNQVYLKDYDADYWSIEVAPEPTTYGAIFGVVGLGIVALRRRRSAAQQLRDN